MYLWLGRSLHRCVWFTQQQARGVSSMERNSNFLYTICQRHKIIGICYLFILSLQQRRCWYWNKKYSYLEIIFPNIYCGIILEIEVIYYLSRKCKDLDKNENFFHGGSAVREFSLYSLLSTRDKNLFVPAPLVPKADIITEISIIFAKPFSTTIYCTPTKN